MKFKGTWIFLALVLGVGGLTFWDFSHEKKEEERKDRAASLVPFSTDQVQSLKLEQNGAQIEVHKTVDGWKLVQPLADSADDSAVDAAVSSLVSQKSMGEVAEGDGVNWALYGLDQPLGKITLAHQNQKRIEISVGQKKSFEGNSYLRKDGENKVYLASSEWTHALERKLIEFRDKRLLRQAVAKISRIKIKNQKGEFTLNKSESWQLKEQSSWKVDNDSVQEFLKIISEARVEDFAEKGPGQSEIRVELSFGDDIWKAEFGRDSKSKLVTAHRNHPEGNLKLNETFYSQLKALKASQFRDKSGPFNFNKDLVKKIEIQTQLKKQALVQDGGTWKLSPEDPAMTVNAELTQKFLESLKGLKVYDYVGKRRSLANAHTMILKGADDQVIFSLTVGEVEKKKVDEAEKSLALAQSNLSSEVFYLESSEVAKLRLFELIKKKDQKP